MPFEKSVSLWFSSPYIYILTPRHVLIKIARFAPTYVKILDIPRVHFLRLFMAYTVSF